MLLTEAIMSYYLLLECGNVFAEPQHFSLGVSPLRLSSEAAAVNAIILEQGWALLFCRRGRGGNLMADCALLRDDVPERGLSAVVLILVVQDRGSNVEIELDVMLPCRLEDALNANGLLEASLYQGICLLLLEVDCCCTALSYRSACADRHEPLRPRLAPRVLELLRHPHRAFVPRCSWCVIEEGWKGHCSFSTTGRCLAS